MKTYHYILLDYETWCAKIWTIQAPTAQDALNYLDSWDTTVMVSPNKIPVYKNKNLLSTDNSDDA